jgi:hypothetical protein
MSHLVCVPLLETLNFAVLLQLQGANSECSAGKSEQDVQLLLYFPTPTTDLMCCQALPVA